MEEDKKWVKNTLEVIINHYKELEDEFRAVRQGYEVELQRLNCEEAIKGLDQVE